jgi:hypothetical protein
LADGCLRRDAAMIDDAPVIGESGQRTLLIQVSPLVVIAHADLVAH